MFALNLNEDSRILSATYPEFAPAGAVMVEALPEGNIADYLYIEGAFIHQPLPPPPSPSPSPEERIAELEAALELLLSGDIASD